MLFWDIQQVKKKHTLIQEGGTPRNATHVYADARKKKFLKKKDTAPSRPTMDKRASRLAQDFNKTHFFAVRGILVKKRGNS